MVFFTKKALLKLSKKFKFKAPILESIYGVLYKNVSPDNLVNNIVKKGIISDI